jgi:inhibitor of cysteine peptidase
MDDCQYITDVTLTVATPTMAVSDATLTATNATLTDRSGGTPSDLSLTVATGTTPTKVDICEAATTGSYTIAGTITYNGSALSGVTVTLSGGATKTTDEDGVYSFTGLSSGTYIVTPSRSGYTFTPSSKSVTTSCEIQLGVDFTATTSGTTYSISGKVTLSGSGLSGVTMTMTLSGSDSGTKETDSSGDFTFSGLSNGTYTITPSKSGYTFTPASLSVTISGANKTGQNFTATQSTSGCSQWSDVIEKYNQYVGGQAGWADVISCYSDYVTP